MNSPVDFDRLWRQLSDPRQSHASSNGPARDGRAAADNANDSPLHSRCVALVGCRAGVGVTTVARQLAFAGSRDGCRVLVIDCDESTTASQDEVCAVASNVENLFLATLPTHARHQGPESFAFAGQWKNWLAEFDRLILDGGSLPNTVHRDWLRLADVVLLIVDPHDTDVSAANAAVEVLSQVGVVVEGTILNRCDVSVASPVQHADTSQTGTDATGNTHGGASA